MQQKCKLFSWTGLMKVLWFFWNCSYLVKGRLDGHSRETGAKPFSVEVRKGSNSYWVSSSHRIKGKEKKNGHDLFIHLQPKLRLRVHRPSPRFSDTEERITEMTVVITTALQRAQRCWTSGFHCSETRDTDKSPWPSGKPFERGRDRHNQWCIKVPHHRAVQSKKAAHVLQRPHPPGERVSSSSLDLSA